jgi:hypothetical protein
MSFPEIDGLRIRKGIKNPALALLEYKLSKGRLLPGIATAKRLGRRPERARLAEILIGLVKSIT